MNEPDPDFSIPVSITISREMLERGNLEEITARAMKLVQNELEMNGVTLNKSTSEEGTSNPPQEDTQNSGNETDDDFSFCASSRTASPARSTKSDSLGSDISIINGMQDAQSTPASSPRSADSTFTEEDDNEFVTSPKPTPSPKPSSVDSQITIPSSTLEQLLEMTQTLRIQQESLESLMKNLSIKQEKTFETLKAGTEHNSSAIESLRNQIENLRVSEEPQLVKKGTESVNHEDTAKELVKLRVSDEKQPLEVGELHETMKRLATNSNVKYNEKLGEAYGVEQGDQEDATEKSTSSQNSRVRRASSAERDGLNMKKPKLNDKDPEDMDEEDARSRMYQEKYNRKRKRIPKLTSTTEAEVKSFLWRVIPKETDKTSVELEQCMDYKLRMLFYDIKEEQYDQVKTLDFSHAPEHVIEQIVRRVWAKVVYYYDDESTYASCASVLTQYISFFIGDLYYKRNQLKLKINSVASELFEKKCTDFGLCTPKPAFITEEISAKFEQLQRVLRFAAELYTVDLFALSAIKWMILRLQITSPNIEQFASLPCNENAIVLALVIVGVVQDKLCDHDTEYLFWVTEAINNINKYFAEKEYDQEADISNHYKHLSEEPDKSVNAAQLLREQQAEFLKTAHALNKNSANIRLPLYLRSASQTTNTGSGQEPNNSVTAKPFHEREPLYLMAAGKLYNQSGVYDTPPKSGKLNIPTNTKSTKIKRRDEKSKPIQLGMSVLKLGVFSVDDSSATDTAKPQCTIQKSASGLPIYVPLSTSMRQKLTGDSPHFVLDPASNSCVYKNTYNGLPINEPEKDIDPTRAVLTTPEPDSWPFEDKTFQNFWSNLQSGSASNSSKDKNTYEKESERQPVLPRKPPRENPTADQGEADMDVVEQSDCSRTPRSEPKDYDPWDDVFNPVL